MQHLTYSMHTAANEGMGKHPQAVMKDLGIKYRKAVPQSISDSWQFWGCSNVPENLPLCLSTINRPPIDYIGWGLSKEEALDLMA